MMSLRNFLWVGSLEDLNSLMEFQFIKKKSPFLFFFEFLGHVTIMVNILKYLPEILAIWPLWSLWISQEDDSKSGRIPGTYHLICNTLADILNHEYDPPTHPKPDLLVKGLIEICRPINKWIWYRLRL